MKIKHQNDTQLVLAGVPGTFRWMLFSLGLGATVTGFVGLLLYTLWNESGPGMYLVPLSVGLLMGLGLFGFGAAQLLARESLVLDKATGKGRYRSNSPIVTTEKPFTFKLENIDSVVVSTATIERPGAADDPGWRESQQVKVSLRVTKPRRSVTLDETQNGRIRRVRGIAEGVAQFLAIEVTRA